MFYVIAYDIPDNKRRTKLHNLLKGFGVWNQFSLFEAHLDSQRFNKMLSIINKIIKKDKDNIKIYYLCKDCFSKIVSIGNAEVTEEKKVIVI